MDQRHDKKLSLKIVGTLLVAGSFFYFYRQATNTTASSLKPSQLDFSKSNIPSAVQASLGSSSMVDSVEKPGNINTDSGNQTEYGKGENSAENTLPSNYEKLGEDKTKWKIFQSILVSKNDNDPRLDKDLKKFGEQMHEALYEKYAQLEDENRSGRGLIAYLVARDMKSENDFNFARKVYEEAPCTSLEKCHNVQSSDPHHSGIDQVTLNYPQMAQLFQIESNLNAKPSLLDDPAYKRGVASVVHRAEEFPVPIVKNKAHEIAVRFGL